MKKRSKGRVRRFTGENTSEALREQENYTSSETFDVEDFLAEGWENVKRQTMEMEAPDIEEEIGEEEASEPEPSTREERQIRRRRAKKKRRGLAYLAILAVVLIIVGVTARGIILLKIEQRDLLAEQQKLEQRKEELEKELTKVEEKDYIERQAREQLHMVKPGEILYILPGEGKD